MGLIKEKILLSEDKIRQLRKRFHNDYKFAKPADKTNLDLVFKMALRHVKLAQEQTKYRGKYEKAFPAIARGICATFGSNERELAACFETNEYVIGKWKLLYPDFKKQISKGKSGFRNRAWWNKRYFKGLYPQLSAKICEIFNATDEQLAECFNVDMETFIQWKHEDEDLRSEIHCARHKDTMKDFSDWIDKTIIGKENTTENSNEKNDNVEQT